MPRRRDTSLDQPELGSMDRPKCPRPAEQRLLQSLITGEAKTLSNAMVRAGFNPTSRTIRNRLGPNGDLREQLEKAMDTAGLTLPSCLIKLKAKMDATKPLTIAGEAITTDDNDAQLRAVDMSLKLLDRAGKLPAEQESGSGGSTITVNIMQFGKE